MGAGTLAQGRRMRLFEVYLVLPAPAFVTRKVPNHPPSNAPFESYSDKRENLFRSPKYWEKVGRLTAPTNGLAKNQRDVEVEDSFQ
jgi:hypothetical protein